MKCHYEGMKQSTGLNKELFEPPCDNSSQVVYKKFMPQSPYSLFNLLSENFDPKDKEYRGIKLNRVHSGFILYSP